MATLYYVGTFHTAFSRIPITILTAIHRNAIGIRIRIGIRICECKLVLFLTVLFKRTTRYFVSDSEWHSARCWGWRCRVEGDAQRTGAGGGRGPRRRRRRVLGGVRRGRPRYRRKAGRTPANRRRGSRGRTGYRDRRRFRRSVARSICPCVGIVQVQGTVKHIAVTLDSTGWWLGGVTLVVAFGFLGPNDGFARK